jgi:uncharacterized protein
MLRSFVALAAAFALALAATPAIAAKPVTDCPLRDAPFSVQSPLSDILLNNGAKAVVNKAMPGRLDKMPPSFAGTETPTFAAILTVETAARFTGMDPAALPAIDAELRKLSVKEADKIARCARYDNEVPLFDLPKGKPRLLVFGKINGFKDVPSVEAAEAALKAMAERKGWARKPFANSMPLSGTISVAMC